jgi:hypothetical protein
VGRFGLAAKAPGAEEVWVSLSIYMDVNVPYAITTGLRLRGMDVLTAQEDGPFSDFRSHVWIFTRLQLSRLQWRLESMAGLRQVGDNEI